MLSRGATKEEFKMSLPSDEILKNAEYTITCAVTVNAVSRTIWPWLVQMGQDRAGFYTYTVLENMFFCDMHNANSIVPEWQKRSIGDFVPTWRGKIGWNIAVLESDRALVYKDSLGGTIGVFIVPVKEGCCRILARLRLVRSKNIIGWLFERLFWDWAHSVMACGMLHGIKKRAETGTGK
jgi:hypothetical protein